MYLVYSEHKYNTPQSDSKPMTTLGKFKFMMKWVVDPNRSPSYQIHLYKYFIDRLKAGFMQSMPKIVVDQVLEDQITLDNG